MPDPKPEIDFGGATPILCVSNLQHSLDYYTRVLGFRVQFQVDGFASVGRGRASIMLCKRDQGKPGTWLWVGVSDADALHEELKGRGAVIRHAPTNYPWGSRELHVTDPDGHVLRFGSDVVPGEPVGDWLDRNGVRWELQPDGSWRANR